MKPDEENPIECALRFLESRGFTADEARNICTAIYSDSPERLCETAPIWIEWCGKIKQDHDCIVALAAAGAIKVQIGPAGIDDMKLSLRDGVSLQ